MGNKKLILISVVLVFVLFLYGCSGTKNKIGALGSTHRHVDFKLYVLGNSIDFTVSKFQVRHEAVHFENKDGDVMHTHATGITLGYFFQTHGMKMDNECLTLDTGNEYCTQGNVKLKVFVKSTGTDWEQILYPADYFIQDLDKILVTYGTEDGVGIQKQMESVTDKAVIT